MKPLLSVKNLNVHYGAIHAIKGISFDIFPGEVVSLFGSNGAGKTSTLRAISGLADCTGQIEFKGKICLRSLFMIVSLMGLHKVLRAVVSS